MLFILTAAVLVSIVCYSWGTTTYKGITKLAGEEDFRLPHFSIVCLLGLAAIMPLAGIFSFFLPLKTWWVRVMFLAPAIVILFKKYKSIKIPFSFRTYHPLIPILCIAILVLMLVMASWPISHPDTLGYHYQNIQWIREYKIIPGLAHLNFRYGIQGLWFPVCALFDFVIGDVNVANLLNLTVAFWFVLFVASQINNAFKEKKLEGFLWVALLAISLWNYTEIRLTITSASPDFIVAIFTWGAIYLFLKEFNPANGMLAAIFSVIAISIKLSSLPIAAIAIYWAYHLLKGKKLRSLSFLILLSAFICSAFIVRNSITSGYLLFPSPVPDLISADWKIDKHEVEKHQRYVTAYARTRMEGYEDSEIKAIVNSTTKEWMPVWWQKQAASDKTILILLAMTLFASLLFFKRFIKTNNRYRIVIATLLAGILYWFYLAPDIRFGFGFIIPFIGIVCYILGLSSERKISKNIISTTVFLLLVFTLSYTTYRFIHFFSPRQLIVPLQTELLSNKKILCNGLEIPVITDDPILQDTSKHCQNFITRGVKLTDGFKAKPAK